MLALRDKDFLSEMSNVERTKGNHTRRTKKKPHEKDVSPNAELSIQRWLKKNQIEILRLKSTATDTESRDRSNADLGGQVEGQRAWDGTVENQVWQLERMKKMNSLRDLWHSWAYVICQWESQRRRGERERSRKNIWRNKGQKLPKFD